jgi:hypothetical protein
MHISIQATIESPNGSSFSQVIQIGEVTREAGVDPASGLGLFVRRPPNSGKGKPISHQTSPSSRCRGH